MESAATAAVDAPDLCPRLTVSVLRDVVVGPSPRWLARRLLLAGMRPINNVVDASNYVMLELGQPTHPYDITRLGGRGLTVRRARPGERSRRSTVRCGSSASGGRARVTPARTASSATRPGRRVGIGGIMGGASSEISELTTEVLLEAAYFTPMAIARTSKRLGLRTEASARFERGCDPWVIEPAVRRFVELLAESVPGLTVADGMLDVRGAVPEPFTVAVPVARVHSQIGVALAPDEIARLLEPIGFTVLRSGEDEAKGLLRVVVPTNRPDVRPEPYGVDDVIEEVARTFGYGNVPRRTPSWPQPGGLTSVQRGRRAAKDVLAGLGASEAWTDTFVSAAEDADAGLDGPAVRVANPLDADKPFLRRSLLPGLLGALAHNAGRRQGDIRLFEVGVVFSHPASGAPRLVERAGAGGRPGPSCPASASCWRPSSPARATTPEPRWPRGTWWPTRSASTVCASCRPAPTRPRPRPTRGCRCSVPCPGCIRRAPAHLVVAGGAGGPLLLGAVGEVDPAVAAAFGLVVPAGAGMAPRRVGWLEVDLGLLLDESLVPRRLAGGGAVSRFPSSDIDLAFVVEDRHPADAVADALRAAAGELLESVHLFDVYRGAGIAEGARSLAYRLRFCSPERTLTDDEVGRLRSGCVEAVAAAFGAVAALNRTADTGVHRRAAVRVRGWGRMFMHYGVY